MFRLAADDEAFQQQRIAKMEHYRQALAEQVRALPHTYTHTQHIRTHNTHTYTKHTRTQTHMTSSCKHVLQVKNKPEQLPAAEPDSLQPIFGVHDKTDGAWDREQKRKAKMTSVEQMKMVAEKEEAEKRQRQQAIQEGINMLARTRKE